MLVKKSFYFIRHGETEHNLKGICAGGLTDTPLTEKGKNQAKKMGNTLKDVQIKEIFSSPLKRAIDTAHLVSSQYPHIIEGLREWDLGNFDEQPVEHLFGFLQETSMEDKIPNGESRKEFFYRSIEAINAILKGNENPFIVAHGGTYWAILYALDLPDEHIHNCQCILFQYISHEGVWKKIEIK